MHPAPPRCDTRWALFFLATMRQSAVAICCWSPHTEAHHVPYRITFRSCRASIVEDERSLSTLAADLAQDGFIVVRRQASGYSQIKTQLAVMERAVESIEPTVE
jgi:hypothetical protein